MRHGGHTNPGARAVLGRPRARLGAAAAALVLGLLLAATAGARAPLARPAGTMSLSDSAHLHLTSHHSFTLNEQGTAAGTIAGTIYIHLTVASTNHVTAEISIYPRGGSITGEASASYRPSGAVASFAGTMRVVRGSGRYAGANGSGLSFTGTVQRSNDAVTVRVSGRMST
ncbi:MAG TPA: hypothetical protein VK790_00150 [Solirubrobacteraceae bacterium]|jgi:hypothetical protein|nr:hypothetical protein [Solirubrobacteraceae bacterium]